MVDRIEAPSVIVVAGSTPATAVTTALPFNPGYVVGIQIVVPPGPSGLMGFQILHSGVTVIPYNNSEWIITDNEIIDWPVSNMPTGDKWQIRAYNSDVYDHLVMLRFLIDEIAPVSTSVQAMPAPVQANQPATAIE